MEPQSRAEMALLVLSIQLACEYCNAKQVFVISSLCNYCIPQLCGLWQLVYIEPRLHAPALTIFMHELHVFADVSAACEKPTQNIYFKNVAWGLKDNIQTSISHKFKGQSENINDYLIKYE